jgi:hypothetical protein
MELIEKRRVGRPMTTSVGINERVKRYRLQERCAELTDDCIELWTSMIRNPSCPWVFRLAAADRLMDRAYGKPPQAVMMDATGHETSLRKVIHEVRWMPPDPADRSAYIAPEPD